LRRRNFADTTVRTYLHGVAHFSRYFRRPPDQLGPEDIRKYQTMLFTKLKFSPNTVILRLASLAVGVSAVLLYSRFEARGGALPTHPIRRRCRHLPRVLSQEEVARLIDAADSLFHSN
jgi:integrase/recombinase XerD